MIKHQCQIGDVGVWIDAGRKALVIIEDYDGQQVVFSLAEFERLASIAPQVLAAARGEPASPASVNPKFGPINADEVIKQRGGE